MCAFASPSYSTGRVSATAPTKAEAFARAMARIPMGAIPVHTGYNGSHSASSDGSNYRGRYTCYILWKKYETP